MCLLAILYRVVDDTPLVLAANREEAYARGGTPLDLRQGSSPFVAGLDPVAGGTWLGINSKRLVVAVTNRRKSKIPEQPRSRGLLVKDLLAQDSARAASQLAARELDSNTYAGCNIICADIDSLWIIHAGDWLRMRSLAPGYHVMTNDDVNEPSDERIRWALERLHDAKPDTTEESLEILQYIASYNGPPAPICLHGSDRGTTASTLLAVSQRPRGGKLLHANGSPDQVPYVDRTDLLWELEALGEETQR